MLKLQQLDKLVTIYEALSEKDRSDVQGKLYEDTKVYLDFKKKAEEEAAEQGNDSPKTR